MPASVMNAVKRRDEELRRIYFKGMRATSHYAPFEYFWFVAWRA
jgi:hypothetical protein